MNKTYVSKREHRRNLEFVRNRSPIRKRGGLGQGFLYDFISSPLLASNLSNPFTLYPYLVSTCATEYELSKYNQGGKK